MFQPILEIPVNWGRHILNFVPHANGSVLVIDNQNYGVTHRIIVSVLMNEEQIVFDKPYKLDQPFEGETLRLLDAETFKVGLIDNSIIHLNLQEFEGEISLLGNNGFDFLPDHVKQNPLVIEMMQQYNHFDDMPNSKTAYVYELL